MQKQVKGVWSRIAKNGLSGVEWGWGILQDGDAIKGGREVVNGQVEPIVALANGSVILSILYPQPKTINWNRSTPLSKHVSAWNHPP